jgi:hypothetical protein
MRVRIGPLSGPIGCGGLLLIIGAVLIVMGLADAVSIITH